MELNINQLSQLLHALQRRLFLVIGCVVLSLVLGVVYCAAATRIYESSARLLIENNNDGISQRTMMPNETNDIETQIKLLKSPVILRTAKSNLPQHVLLDEDILSVSAPRRTKLIDITYRSPNPQYAHMVVDAVTNAYLRFIDETHRSSSQTSLEYLMQQREQRDRELDEMNNRLIKLRQESGLIHSEGSRTTINEQGLIHLYGQWMEAREKRSAAEATYRSLARTLENSEAVNFFTMRLAGPLGERLVSEQLGLRSDYLRYHDSQTLLDMRESETELQNIASIYGSEHPQFKSLQQRIEDRRACLANPFDTQDTQLESRNTQASEFIRRMAETQLEEARECEKELEEQFREQQQLAAAENAKYAEVQALEDRIKQFQTFNDAVVKRIQELDLGQDIAQLRVTPVGFPEIPEDPIWPSMPKVMLLALLAGPLAGVGLALLMERLDNTFQSPEDIKHSLQVPVFGNVPQLTQDQNHKHEFIVIDRPKSPAAEAFRTIRTAMLFNKDFHLISVTSPFQGDGKSTVICNTASALAQAGKRTLLIDCDLRRPRMRSIWGLPLSRGLAHLLDSGNVGAEDIAGEIRSSGTEHLEILPSGPIPPNPSELLEKTHFMDILNWAKEHYDFVLLDSPPVLPVADAGIIARLVDGVVLVVRIEKDSRTATGRAKDALSEVGGQLAGIVVNGVDRSSSYGYYYKQGRYGSGYYSAPKEQEEAACA